MASFGGANSSGQFANFRSGIASIELWESVAESL